MNFIDKLILGTAQLGLPYGIANTAGKPDIGVVSEILYTARAAGINMLDTASSYGQSEDVLGQCGVGNWLVITKVRSLSGLGDDQVETAVRESVLRSLDLLKLPKLHAVLAHDSRDMTGPRGVRFLNAMQALRSEGLVRHFGVSVYDPEEVSMLSPEATEIVQAPFNILDRRIVSSGQASVLHARHAELHVRSVFLQGLLLMPAESRPKRFARWSSLLDRFDALARETGLDPLGLCLGFVAQQDLVTRCVIGAENPTQISQIVAAFVGAQKNDTIEADDLLSQDLDLIDPRRWGAAS